MADAVARCLRDACDRYAMDRELRAGSKKLYSSLTSDEDDFLKAWKACTFCGLKQGRLLRTATTTWDDIFERAPAFQRDVVMYRAVEGKHALEIRDVSRGGTFDLDRYSSFAHSPEMARIFMGGWGRTATVLCVKIKKGTRFVFASGRDTGHGTTTVDATQGEVVLAPMTLKKSSADRTVELCHDRIGSAKPTRVTIVSMTAI